MQNMQNMQNMNRKDQCTKSGTWISVFTSWKVRTTLLPHPNPPFSALSAAPGSICSGLHFWRRCCTGSSPTDTIDSIPAAGPPSPEQFLPDLKRVSINKTDSIWRGSKEDRVCLSSARIQRCPSNVRPRGRAHSAVHCRLLLGRI
jgi:hypothetical protein